MIAGSLITVAGLTFSITMVVLQLASSQFSPRILRTFFGDRVTQLTIGTYVGTFVYAILVLRAVGSFGDAGFVPRLSVTLASLLGIGAVVLLIVFLQHVSQMVQVSHVDGGASRTTRSRAIDVLYPERYGEPADGRGRRRAAARWRADARPVPAADGPGYVQRIELEALSSRRRASAERVAILVCPGDFVGVETADRRVWPAAAAERLRGRDARRRVGRRERDLDQDVDFGLRQLTDTALQALSPGINDPTTAVTCIGYLRAILVRLAERADPPAVRRFPDAGLTVVVRHRGFERHLESLVQISRYTGGDAWVTGELLGALGACQDAARRCGASARLRPIGSAAAAIAEQASAEAGSARDRERIHGGLARMDADRSP